MNLSWCVVSRSFTISKPPVHAMSECLYVYICQGGWVGGVSGDSHTHMFRKSKMHLALSSSRLTYFLNPCVFQENLNPYVPDLLSLSHLHVVGKSPLMSKKTYEQFLWPLWAFVLSRGKMCFACMDGTLSVTIRKFSKIWKGDRVNPNFDQSPVLFPNAKTIEKKVLSDSRKRYAVNITASLYFMLWFFSVQANWFLLVCWEG